MVCYFKMTGVSHECPCQVYMHLTIDTYRWLWPSNDTSVITQLQLVLMERGTLRRIGSAVDAEVCREGLQKVTSSKY